ncbi:MAG: queuine tRNA-ribosyltransferase [Kosmotogales bacterium]|nr:queuine tRNA-ribosyltransferase [Kosmotogales bacterium]
MLKYEILKKSKETKARLGKLSLPHGEIFTPVFMPVGTNATVKAMWTDDLKDLDVGIILGNAFHLYLRPGLEVIDSFNGLHNFMKWDRAILTDSGGFQVFSIRNKKVEEEGVKIKSPLDGSEIFMTPELSMKIQMVLGSDIAMAFDECVHPDMDEKYVEESIERTYNWAKECKKYNNKENQSLFGIIQGGFSEELRKKSAEQIVSLDFEGYAIGGLSVGESFPVTKKILDAVMKYVPEDKPRYIMGIGTPDLIISAVENGIDMFDCVLPTRMGRHGTALTNYGKINLKAGKYKFIDKPIDEECNCKVCKKYSIGYIHHLFKRDEIFGKMLLTYHNLHFLLDFVKRVRDSIYKDEFLSFKKECLDKGLITLESF